MIYSLLVYIERESNNTRDGLECYLTDDASRVPLMLAPSLGIERHLRWSRVPSRFGIPRHVSFLILKNPYFNASRDRHDLAPEAGIEPATNCLTGNCSTAELLRNLLAYTCIFSILRRAFKGTRWAIHHAHYPIKTTVFVNTLEVKQS